MQQRQLRLGDILDDYCPRERRLSNHAVVAMIGQEVKRTRCVTCDGEHEYKHAKGPRPRRKPSDPAVLYAHGAAGSPKRVAHEPPVASTSERMVDERMVDRNLIASADVPNESEVASAVPVEPSAPRGAALLEDRSDP